MDRALAGRPQLVPVVMTHRHPTRQAFVQHYHTNVLDSALLRMPTDGFIAPRTRNGSAVARRETSGRRRAAGIYGSIITAAILTAAGGVLPTLPLAVAVALVVYWIAEEYAELLGEQVEGGRLPDRRRIRSTFVADGECLLWPSYGPLIALVLARLAGASTTLAADIGLGAAVVLLVYHAWAAGRVARLRGPQLALMTATAALLGAVMIVLKTAVLVRLH